MEQRNERSFVCKFCDKRFPCGKSLGGHIRTHVNEISFLSDEDETSKLKMCDNGGQSSYDLRENPKKSKRFADQIAKIALKQQQQQHQHQHHHHHHHQILVCKECGKGFSSLKALCGHMACHSEREKVVMDSQSDTETSSAPIRRRSNRLPASHHKAFAGELSSSAACFANGNSSSASEIEQEQEELALCLMMLSRDSGFKLFRNVMNSVGESSDNNSVILETKSSSGEMKIINVKNLREFCSNGDETYGKNLGQENQFKSGVHLYDSDNSDSGYFRNGPKKVDSDVSVDGFLRNSGSDFNKPPLKQRKNMNRLRNSDEVRKESFRPERSSRSSTKYDLRTSKRVCSNNRKKIKYETKTDHNEFNESVYDSGENSIEADSCSDMIKQSVVKDSKLRRGKSSKSKKKTAAKKKSKGHECPICFRVFKSGQALGGHKRSHFIGNHENTSTLVIRQNIADMPALIDLNLPAPVDE